MHSANGNVFCRTKWIQWDEPCLNNETSVTRSIWIQAKASPTSEVSQHPAREGTPSMHSAWWEHRGACHQCAGCRKVESYSWRVGLFVSGKLLVVVNVHQAPNMLELVAESTLCRISKIDEAGALVGMASINRGSTKYSRVTLAMSKNVNLSQGLSTALMSWRVTMGSIGRPPWTTKIWSMERRLFKPQLLEKGPSNL